MNRNTDKFYLNIQVGKSLIKAGNYEKLSQNLYSVQGRNRRSRKLVFWHILRKEM